MAAIYCARDDRADTRNRHQLPINGRTLRAAVACGFRRGDFNVLAEEL